MNFLEKPRYTADVTKHFGIPDRLAQSQLRRAIKTGSILVSEERMPWKIVGSSHRGNQVTGYLHIRQGSPLLLQGAVPSSPKVRGVKFLSKAVNPAGRRAGEGRAWLLPLDSDRRNHILKGVKRASSDSSSPSGVAWWLKPTSRRIQPLTHTAEFDLLKSLSTEELTLGEMHRRTGISKHIIKRLVQKGVLSEVWGPHGVGIRYKLSDEGWRLLGGIEAASLLPPGVKRPYVSLNTKVPY